ncbi:hypothetical protein [Streptomyces cavernicola]|uniref:DUF2188 domain-containing protein n=1 Tax=Streptomyces cavernicola TaxID=3043613 RepID=A0ABT6SHB2_9ACTN|nr:hypothetical protein [Streptomyces sp. B-S-A6]MDI3406646.1 hypothetical protein [Streptomyces sp. B-S-A6]
MARRERDQKQPPFGMPEGILLLETPEGWRHSVRTADGGTVCGRLSGVAVDADPAEARAAAAAMVVRSAREFHGADVEVSWDPSREPGAGWTAQVVIVDVAAGRAR